MAEDYLVTVHQMGNALRFYLMKKLFLGVNYVNLELSFCISTKFVKMTNPGPQ